MITNRWRWLTGFAVAVALLAGAAGTAQMQEPPRANDGQTLADQRAETQATFRAVWGDQAERQWVTEHNAELARRAPPPVMADPTTAPPEMGDGTPAATATLSVTETVTPTATIPPTLGPPPTAVPPTAVPPTTAPTVRPTAIPTPAPGRTGGGPYP